MRKMKILWVIAAILVLILYIGYLLITSNIAKGVFYPTGLSLEEEMAWEKEHGFWGDFDRFERESYEVKGVDGYVLHAELVKSEIASDKYVILTHGYRSNRYGSVKYLEAYRKLGYHCIIYDVRGHGENAKSVVTLGNRESGDLRLLIEDTYARYGQDIYLGLHGESMGSSISLSVLAYKPNVKFVVADCGFTNLYDLLKEGYEANGAGFMMPGVYLTGKWFYGVDMKQTSAIDALADNAVPIVFIHGEADTFIRPNHSRLLCDANPGVDDIHIVESATHAQSIKAAGVEEYSKWISHVAK